MARKGLNVLTVFLASPSDLGAERQIVRDVADRLNSVLNRTVGWTIELLGWEDTMPGISRPQALINADVDACDLFIGMLWHRWGTPPGSGDYTSGFEEEFDLALTRRGTSGAPEVWLFFKRVDPDRVEDAGEQLKRVLAFRRAQEAGKELLYREFSDTNDWRDRLYNWLLEYVLSLALPGREARTPSESPEAAAAAAVTETTAAARSQDMSIDAHAYDLLAEALKPIIAAVSRNDLDSVLTDDNARFVAARSFLLAAHLMAHLNAYGLLGTHEINLMYRYRGRFTPTRREGSLVLRTVVAGRFDTTPGWYWFREVEGDLVVPLLQAFAITDSEAAVRRGALDLLRRLEVSLTQQFIAAALSDDEEPIRSLTRSYIEEIGDAGVIPILQGLVEAFPDRDPKLFGTILKLAAKFDPALVLTSTDVRFSGHYTDAVPILRQTISVLSEVQLRAALSHPDTGVRAAALAELVDRGMILKDEAVGAMTDWSAEAKAVVYRTMVRVGLPITPAEVRSAVPAGKRTLLGFGRAIIAPEEIVEALLTTWSTERLRSAIDWFSVDGPMAYKLLAARDPSLLPLRDDLADDFKALKTASIDKIRLRSPEAAQALEEAFSKENLNEFILGKFAGSALAGLAVSSTAADVVVARKHLSPESSAVRAAIRIVKQHGDESDVPSLLAVADKGFGEAKAEAIEAALALARDLHGAAETILAKADATTGPLVIRHLMSNRSAESELLVAAALRSPDQNTRSAAVLYFAAAYEPVELQALLERYMDESPCYYSVVCWLDRILYAPGRLRTLFQRGDGTCEF